MSQRMYRTTLIALAAGDCIEYVEHADLPKGPALGAGLERASTSPPPPGVTLNEDAERAILAWVERQTVFPRILPKGSPPEPGEAPFGTWTGTAPGRGRDGEDAQQRVPFEVRGWRDAPSLVLIDNLQGAVRTLEGHFLPWPRGGEALIAALGQGFAALEVMGADGEYLLELEPPVPGKEAGTATIYRIRRAAPESHAGLSRWERPPCAEIEDGIALRLLGDAACEPWLQRELVRLSSSTSVVDRIASLGLLGRLFRPVEAAPGDAYARGLESPSGRVRAWAEATLGGAGDSAVRFAVEAMATERAEALIDVLGRLETTAIDGGDTTALTRRIVRDRDDLESVAQVLEAAGGPGRTALREALDALDRQAEEHLSEMTIEADDRLRAVSWQEPTMWWGTIAEH